MRYVQGIRQIEQVVHSNAWLEQVEGRRHVEGEDEGTGRAEASR